MVDFVWDEVEPLIAGSVRLRKKVGAGAYRQGDNSVRRKVFEGGFVVFVGGGSSTDLAFRTVRTVVIDEVDKLKTLPREGDSDTLISKRVSTFSDSVVLRFSKPTTEDGSRIWRHFLRGGAKADTGSPVRDAVNVSCSNGPGSVLTMSGCGVRIVITGSSRTSG
jgi:phage terminase large subunit GpA-like protein